VRNGLKIAGSMLDLIGGIPLVRLNRLGADSGAEILVKPEFLNPSGSIKDRIAKVMVEAAEAEGRLGKGQTVIEATTGNTGTALAFVCAVKGHKMAAFAPKSVTNRSRTAIMLAYGARLETVDPSGGAAGCSGDAATAVHGGRVELKPRQACLELERDQPGHWWARQFSNPGNVQAHRDWTAPEILEATDGRLDAFVASVGTGGTLLGVAQALKAHDPRIIVIGVEPSGSPILPSPEAYPVVPGISDGIVPELLASGLVDRSMTITNDEAIDTAHALAQEEGIFAGMSSGANTLAAVRVARELGPGRRVVTILPDSRDRYLEVELYTT
jgi:cysteine synthase A